MPGIDPADLCRLVAAPAVRTFTDRPVPEETVRGLVDVARRTGSARNRQPWRFRIVADGPTRSGLARLGAFAAHLAAAPCVLVLLAPDDSGRDTDFDLGRVAQSVVLAAAAAGLGCCPATVYPERNVERAGRLLGIGPGWHVRWCFALGFPGRRGTGRSAVPTGRLGVDELLI